MAAQSHKPNRVLESTTSPRAGVQRQRKLPFRMALEIAYKNIRMRLSRSLLVTSGIVLALAFLMSILTSDSMVQAMRAWMEGFNAQHSEEYRRLEADRARVRDAIRPKFELLQREAASPGKLGKDDKKLDPRATFGIELSVLQKELKTNLPGSADNLLVAMTKKPELVATMRQWIELARQRRAIVDQLNGPEDLKAKMTAAGVATTPEEVQSNKTQTTWLVGLALLVAFVGILNAMLMSVTERFREIGTMKCLGALDGFIVKLFLLESLFQGIIGTIIGIGIGLMLAFGGTYISYGQYATRNLPWAGIIQGMIVCFLVGVALTVAGAVYPAWQAARMQPIEAMRVET